MWEFLDRLLTIALPRIRDFRGLSAKQFDGRGNYTFGLNEQSMFHEIDPDRIDRPRGMDITVVTTATNDEEGRALLQAPGLPVQGELIDGQEGADHQGRGQAEVQGPRLHPLPACGRPHAVLRKFGLCRICVREMAHAGRAARRQQVQLVAPLRRRRPPDQGNQAGKQ